MKNIRFLYWAKLFVIMLLFMGGGFYINFAVDTYWTFMLGFNFAAADTLTRNGRPIIAIVYKIYDIIGASGESFYYFSFVLAFICFVIAIALYERVLSTFIDNENLRIILSLLSILNLFAIEFFAFLEKGLFAFAILCNVIAVYYIDKALSEDTKMPYIWAMIAVFLATLTYQGTIALFFILSLPVMYRRTKEFRKYIKGLIMLVLVYWVPVSIDMLLFKIWFSPDRAVYKDTLLDEIYHVIFAYKKVYKSAFDLLPSYMFFVMAILAMFISFAAILLKEKRTYMDFINYIILILAVNILPIASVLMSPIVRPRIVYPLASLFGVYAVNYYINCPIRFGAKEKVFSFSFSTICVIVLVAQYFSYNKIYTDRYKMNYADFIRVQEIGQAITEYELQTGNKITQIAFYRDANHDIPYYSGLYFDGDLVVSGFHSWDSQLRMVNYYLGADYAICPEDDSYAEMFSKLDWHGYSPSQIICDKDTLHYCVY